MDKVLVEVFLPASNMSYDIYVPISSPMSEVLLLVCTALKDLAHGKFKPSEDTVLCEASSGIIYNINMSVTELGIRNGSRLILI